MSFDSAWHQLFPGLLSPKLDAAAPSSADDFFGFTDPTVALHDAWSSSASVDSAASTMDTRSAPSPKPKPKPRSRRTSTRKIRSGSKLAQDSSTSAEPVVHTSQPPKKAVSGASPTAPAPFQHPPGQYQFKPIMVRDMNSVPAMFKNMPSLITQAPMLPHIGPKNGHPDNILLMIAPQPQLSGKRRKTSVPAGQLQAKQHDSFAGNMIPMQRSRSRSEPILLDPPPCGLRTDQQMADYKRRKMMQYAYEQMESLVPARYYEKPSRANVLMGAVEYITQLKTTISEMELRLAKSPPDTREDKPNKKA